MSAVAKKEVGSVVPAQSNALTPMEVLDRAIQSGASPDTLERIMSLQERWDATHARKAFDEALSLAKAEMPVIFKNKTVDFTSSKGRTTYQHEDLAGIARQIDPVLTKHGLSYRFRTTSGPNEPVSVTCIVSHRLGHSEENTLSAGRDESGNKNSIQAVGSTVTYLQRYTLKAALGLAASDDDDAKTVSVGGPISAAQVEQLRSLIVEIGADIPKFCKYMKVGTLEEIPTGQFSRAISALEARRQ